MTFLDIVNKVLVRLRENEVTTVQETPYSKLIGAFVNRVKHEAEDAWDWSALRTTITATTASGTYKYTLTGAGVRFKMLDVINDTNNFLLSYQTSNWFNKQFLITNTNRAMPAYWNLNGVDSSGDSQVDLFPIPDGVYSIRFNIVKPQDELTLDTDVPLIPYQILVEGALARAISERGEDGGYQEQEIRYNKMLSDYIAIEAGNRPDETIWYLA